MNCECSIAASSLAPKTMTMSGLSAQLTACNVDLDVGETPSACCTTLAQHIDLTLPVRSMCLCNVHVQRTTISHKGTQWADDVGCTYHAICTTAVTRNHPTGRQLV